MYVNCTGIGCCSLQWPRCVYCLVHTAVPSHTERQTPPGGTGPPHSPPGTAPTELAADTRGERRERRTKHHKIIVCSTGGILTVSTHIEDGGPADEAVWIVKLVLLVGCVVFGPHLIRDGPGNGVHQVTIEAAVSTNVHRSWPSPAQASKKKNRT